MLIKESLKIFVDGYLLNKEHQGTKTYIKELYKEFSKRNKSVKIYIGCFEDLSVVDEFADFSNIHFLFYKNQNRFIRMLNEIPKLIKKH